MPIYVEYYQPSAIDPDRLVPACGDRASVQLDARQSADTHHADAIRFNGYRRPFYAAYRLLKGDSIARAIPLTPIIPLGLLEYPQ